MVKNVSYTGLHVASGANTAGGETVDVPHLGGIFILYLIFFKNSWGPSWGSGGSVWGVLGSRSPSTDQQGVFPRRPDSCLDQFCRSQASASSVPSQKNTKKRTSTHRVDLEIWPSKRPFGGRKRKGELKSVWTDPFRARTEPPEPSCGRFGPKSARKPGFGSRKKRALTQIRAPGKDTLSIHR